MQHDGGESGMRRVPDPEVADEPIARRYTAEYKARILKEADQLCRRELGALLRREGLYSSQISEWRKQREHALKKRMDPPKRGPKSAEPDPLADRVAQLERENAALQRRLKQAETIIGAQRRISEILSIPLNPPDSDKND